MDFPDRIDKWLYADSTEYFLDIARDTAWMAMEYNPITWESTLRGVIDPSAGHLVRAGYTPKWLKAIEETPEPKDWPVYD